MISAARLPGTKGKTGSVNGVPKLFTPTSTFDVPNNATGNNYDLYVYGACAPLCGKDVNGVWQAWQEVSPLGLSALSTNGVAQTSCTSVAGGGTGPTVPNPVNTNAAAKNTPPGN